MRGTPGQLKVLNDQVIGDGANHRCGNLDIRGGIITSKPAIGISFTDRGDVSGWDRTNFTTDALWHDWDISAIVPAGATAVLICIEITDDAAGSSFYLRRDSSTWSAARIVTQVANVMTGATVIIPLPADRIIKYYGTAVTFTSINAYIVGWFT